MSNDNDNDIGKGRHCVFNMHVHLVSVTQYRRGVFTKEILDDLRLILEAVCIDFESELVELEEEDDHLHLLVNYPPKVPISHWVNRLKGVSSRMIRQKIPQHCKKTVGWRVVVEHLSPSFVNT